MKTIKIIELLNKIAKGEEVPNMIKYDGNIYYKKRNVYKHTNYYESEYNNLLIADIQNSNQLNDLVETSEEEKKLPKKIECKGSYNSNKGYEDFNDNEKILVDKINEVLDYLES